MFRHIMKGQRSVGLVIVPASDSLLGCGCEWMQTALFQKSGTNRSQRANKLLVGQPVTKKGGIYNEKQVLQKKEAITQAGVWSRGYGIIQGVFSPFFFRNDAVGPDWIETGPMVGIPTPLDQNRSLLERMGQTKDALTSLPLKWSSQERLGPHQPSTFFFPNNRKLWGRSGAALR